MPFQVHDHRPGRGVVEVRQHQPIADDVGRLQLVGALCNDLAPDRVTARQVDRDQAIARRCGISDEPQARSQPIDQVPVVGKIPNQFARLPAGLRAAAQVDRMDIMARCGTDRAGNHRPAPVRGHARRVVAIGVFGGRINQFVCRLRRAEAVKPNRMAEVGGQVIGLVAAGWEARIEQAFIADPREFRVFNPTQFVGQRAARGNIDEAHAAPVAAAILRRESQKRAVMRRLPLVERDGAVDRPRVGIEQQVRFSEETRPPEQLRLVLQTGVAGEKVSLARLARNAEAFVIEQAADAGAKRRAHRQTIEISAGYRVLTRNPVGHLRVAANVVFEPTIGIGNPLAESDIDHWVATRRGVCWLDENSATGLGAQ